MAYNDIIDRVGAAGEIPRQLSEAITGMIETQSTAMMLGKKVPTTTKDSRIPILSSVPDAYFVTGDTGLKQSTKATMTNETLVAEEIAAIIVVPDTVMADSEFDLWEMIAPLLTRAFARRIDKSVIFGESSPASWPAGMVPQAIAAGNMVTASADPIVDLLRAAQIVAEQEYNPTDAAVSNGYQYRISAARSDAFTGSPVNAKRAGALSVAGLPILTNPVYWDKTIADVVVADWDNVVLGMRQDMRFEFFKTGVIQDETGAIVMNLLQQDSTALRATMRVGYRLAKPVTQSGVAGVPVSVVLPASPSS